jgi:hypothetical protein
MNPAEQIDQLIKNTPDWRGEMLKKLRLLVVESEPKLVEEWKWGTPVYSHNGLVCALGIFKEYVKINFFKGAALVDPDQLFYPGQTGKVMRSIDFRESDKIEETALKKLIASAVKLNLK